MNALGSICQVAICSVPRLFVAVSVSAAHVFRRVTVLLEGRLEIVRSEDRTALVAAETRIIKVRKIAR